MSKKHRGRIQAQGGNTEKSVSWSQDEPLSKVDGLRLLNELENQLTEKEKKEREKQLQEAQRFIENANGLDAPKDRSFRNKKLKGVRIDIEINSGTAFVCILFLILVFYYLLK